MVKAYGVSSLLNCIGNVVDKVVAEAISSYWEASGALHPGQMGAADNVG
jgi:hypothetical protein